MDNFKIYIDTREQQPYRFDRWQVETERTGLSTGDYSLAGFDDRVGIERKSLDDLIGCLMGKDRQRFEKELARGRAYELFAVVIEAGMDDIARGRYKSKMKPEACLQSVTAFYIRYQVPFLFCGNRAGAEYLTYSTLTKYIQEIEKRYRHAAGK
ncbi:MAG: ERCC4 domain-containing protein [Desulfosalsimonas sp.]|uniref:ERCC4 domain-containing protein n=1 Tax=Desulfosalsimonas sp. TaxID=3073848 RepID=UPI003970ABC1